KPIIRGMWQRIAATWHEGLDARASVGLWVALMAPVLSASLSLGIEVSRWSAVQISAQRTADGAALAGALYYSKSASSYSREQNTATYAAHMAELNGVSGATSPSWAGATQTL